MNLYASALVILSGFVVALTVTLGAQSSHVADAAMAGDLASVKALLQQGGDVNAAQGDGMTALHWTAMKGDAEMARMLVFAGANVKATTRLGGNTAAATAPSWRCCSQPAPTPTPRRPRRRRR
jgi:hypothetical protein